MVLKCLKVLLYLVTNWQGSGNVESKMAFLEGIVPLKIGW